MCFGGRKRPSAPRPAPPPPPPPAPPPLPPPPPPPPLPEPPLPPPTVIPKKEMDTKLKRKTSKREEMQQASRGTRALRIPLNTGTSGGNSLNIPK